MAGALLLGLAATLVLAPFQICPACLGDAEDCPVCEGKARASLYRRWTAPPGRILVGAVEGGDWSTHVLPRMGREKINVGPSSMFKGIIEFHSDSLANARRAREILSRDADEKKYKFWCPGRPSPWGAKN